MVTPQCVMVALFMGMTGFDVVDEPAGSGSRMSGYLVNAPGNR